VCRCGGARAEQAGRLHDDVDAEVLPWKSFRIGLLQDADLVTVDVEPTTGDLDGAGPRAVRRVVAQEVGERLRWRQVVDGDDLDRRLGGTACPVRRDPHQIPPDSAHPVDAHSYAHVLALPRLSLLTSWMRLRCSSHGRSAFPVGQRTLREGVAPVVSALASDRRPRAAARLVPGRLR
jgi:hypothetical protein